MSTKAWGGTDSRKARAICAPLVEAGTFCFRCRKPILPGQLWQADHMIEREHGGTDDPSNLHPSHKKCNESSGGKRGAAITNSRRRARGSQKASTQAESGLFEEAGVAHARCPLIFSPTPDELPETRARAAILSYFPEDTVIDEAHEGSRWLGFELKQQGIEVAQVANALNEDGHPLYETVVVEISRQSAKTTSVLSLLLGRCLARPGYRVASIAQNGLKAREKLSQLVNLLRAAHFEELGLGRCVLSGGSERIEFANGSIWRVFPPKPESFRSSSFDAVFIDEGGELDPASADELLAGILPTMDTSMDAQLIIAGTPGLARAGILWDHLEKLRAGVPGVGGVVYEAGDREVFVDMSDPDNPVPNYELLLRTHAGISSGLTTTAKILSRLPTFGLEKWCREYLCQWPRNAAVAALDTAAWEACGTDQEPERPENCGVAFDVDKDGGSSAIVAAWRNASGKACFEVLAFGPGSDWLPREAREIQQEHRGPFAYNNIGYNIEAAQAMTKVPTRVRTTQVDTKAHVGGAARIEKEVSKRNVEHYHDAELTKAVESSQWRPLSNARAFMSGPGQCALVAASEALWVYDQRAKPESTGRRSRVVTGASELAQRRAARERRTS